MKKEKKVTWLAQTVADLREGLYERDQEIELLRQENESLWKKLVAANNTNIRLAKKVEMLIPIKERKVIFTDEK